MLDEPTVIVCVSVARELLRSQFTHAFCRLLRVEYITLIISTCARTVGAPICETHPTKFVTAAFTCHVIATLVLLNWCLALGAWFCVLFQPLTLLLAYLGLFVSFFVFFGPCLKLLACRGVVWSLAAHEAELNATDTLDVAGLVGFVVNCLFAVRIRAPTNRCILVHISQLSKFLHLFPRVL